MARDPGLPAGDRMSELPDARLDHLLEVLSRASVGDLDVRVEVSAADLEDPIGLIANAVNLLLDDLAYRQREREAAIAVATEARAKEEFLAYLSHDMQTPLALLLGTLRLLESSPTDDELATAVPIMQRAASRLQRFVQQFLDLARIGADRPLLVQHQVVDVRHVAERVAALFADSGPIAVEVQEDLPSIRADEERVEQILANLVNNAVKYAGRDARIHIGARVEGSQVALEVVDDGVGMTPEDQRTAFTRYERGAAATGTSGSGLGLYLARALAEAQDGTLDLASAPGEGTRFTLRLPVAEERSEGAVGA